MTARRPRRAGAGALERVLAALPSVLTHPEDYGYRAASLWTDLQLLRRLRATGGEVVLATRPAWALLAAAAAPPDAAVVAQEHLNFHAHRPALAADVRRRYRDLDALVVLTEADRADYSAARASAWCGSRTRRRRRTAGSRASTRRSSRPRAGSRPRRASTC